MVRLKTINEGQSNSFTTKESGETTEGFKLPRGLWSVV